MASEDARSASSWDIFIRLLMIGDSDIGKTCLLCRFANDTFDTKHGSTIGIDFKMKTVLIADRKVRIQIWDTAGQEKYDTITKQCYRRTQGVFFVYDIINMNSFKNLKRKWIRHVHDFAAGDVEMMLIANKSDRNSERQVDVDQGRQLASQLKIPFYETSAKNAENVEKAFLELAEAVVRRRREEEMKDNSTMDLSMMMNGGGGSEKNGEENPECCIMN